MINILVTGDRNWTDYTIIYRAIEKAWKELADGKSTRHGMVFHGGADGADKLAGKAAFYLGLGTHVYPANWSKYKKGAGPIRNELMLKENKIDIVLAFHDNLKDSKGTKDMVRRALEEEKPIRLYKSDGSFVELNQLGFDNV